MMDDYEELPTIHPTVLASNQVIGALAHLDRHPDTLVRWPFPALDELTGPMGEGEVWFVCAFSGGGKTTFIVSAIEAWRQQGKKVFVMPLELQPNRFRTYLACMETGIYPGDALSGALRADPTRQHDREFLKAALKSQVQSAYTDHVMISEQRAINVRGLEQGMMEAKSFGADIVIVDHIDHIEGDKKNSLFESAKQVSHAALKMGQDNGLLCVFTSQLNMDIARKDSLSKYSAPQVQQVLFPTPKLTVATGMIGLYRPLRGPGPDETPEEFKRAIQTARSGETQAADALEKGVMGVVFMKSRNYGQREGVRIKLAVEHGRVQHLSERDMHATHYKALRRI